MYLLGAGMHAPNDELRVALVGDTAFVRDVIVECLQKESIAISCNAENLDEISSDCEADIVIVVEASPGDVLPKNGEMSAICSRFARWLVIGACGHGSTYQVLRQLAQRPVSIAPFAIHREDIPHLVQIVSRAGSLCVDHACQKCPNQEMQRLTDASLDQSQWEVLRLLAAGASNKHIAAALQSDEGRVKALVRRTMIAIDAENRTQAAVTAARAGL